MFITLFVLTIKLHELSKLQLRLTYSNDTVKHKTNSCTINNNFRLIQYYRQ